MLSVDSYVAKEDENKYGKMIKLGILSNEPKKDCSEYEERKQ